jgi:RimJ/RimL family protein N-acetyltransferase
VWPNVNKGIWDAGLHRVSLSCFKWNEVVRRLYEKLGFRSEGRREAYWFDGRRWDLFEFAIGGGWREKGEVVKLLG